jgi:hypothetical protein
LTARARALTGYAACAGALALFTVRVVVPAASSPDTVGFVAYYTEARVLLESPRDLPRVYDQAWLQARIDRWFGRHVPDLIQAMPPTMSLMLLPVAWLPPSGARVAWVLISVGLWIAGLAALANGLGLRPVAGVPPVVGLAGLTSAYAPLADNLRQGQGYALLFFFLCLLVRGLLRPGQRLATGVPLGLMLVVKSAGLWLVAELAAARRWRVLLGAAAGALAVALAASPAVGPAGWRRFLDGFGWLAANRASHVTAYQTLTSFWGHLLAPDPVWNPGAVADLPRLARVLTLATTVALLVASARLQRWPERDTDALALTVGMLVSLVVSVAPLAEGHQYLLVLPALVIAWWWVARRRLPPRAWLPLAACTGLLCVPFRFYGSPRLANGWLALLAYPRLYGALGLWAWLARAGASPRENLTT